MSKIPLFVFVSILCLFNSIILNSAFSKYNYKVGKSPLAGFYSSDNQTLNIFCAGYDAGYDGEFDPEQGDEKSSWWVSDKMSSQGMFEPKKIIEFDDGFLFPPFRPAIKNDSIFIPIGDRIILCDLKNSVIINDNFLEINAQSLSVFNEMLFISVRYDKDNDWVIDSNFVIIYDLSQHSITDTIPANVNVQQTIPFEIEDQQFLAVLNEGNFGSNDSHIQIYIQKNSIYELLETINIGDAANHILIKNDSLFVVNNGSHEINIIDITKFEITSNIKIPTSGWDGPREIFIIPNENETLKELYGNFIIPAYDGNMYIYDFDSESPKATINTGLKNENLNLWDNSLIVCSPFDETYIPNDELLLLQYELSVAEKDDVNKFALFPNPTQDHLNISLEKDISQLNYDLEIYSILGVSHFVSTENINLSENQIQINLNNLNLTNGAYMLKLKIADLIYIDSFIYIR